MSNYVIPAQAVTPDSLELLTHPERWVQEASCAQIGGDAWFPEKGGNSEAALRICRRCPVQLECLEFAVRTRQKDGIWGGKSVRQREAMRKGRA